MKKSLRIFLMFTMVCSIILQTNNIIRAQEVPSNVITSAKITDASGKPFAEGVTIGPWQAFRIYAEYALPDHMVHAGDTTTMILPIGFGTAAPDHFEIKDGDNLIATGTLYNEKPGKIVLTYTKYAEEHSGTHGSFYFNVNVNGEEQSQSGKIPVTLTVNGKVIPAGEVNYKKPQWVNQPLRKGGWMLNDKTRGKYDIRINESNNVLVNAKLVDTLESPSVKYVKDSIKILQGKWQNLGSTELLKQQKDVTEKFKSENRIKFEGNRLTIDIGNLPKEVETRGFQILYEVKLNYEPLAGEEIHNKVDLTTDGSDSHQSNFYKIRDAGGVGEGYVYKIKIKKTGKDGAPLAGAEFDVIRIRNKQKVGTIKSGADGTGELGKLLLDDYNLVETKAPAGHMPLKDPILIKSSDFGSNKIAERKIENKKISKIDINGEKTWDDANNQDGKRPDRIRVNLFANQQPIQNVEVRPDVNGKWKYSFKDLPEYDNEGHKITYTITEDTISGYTSKVEGYNIKNSYTPEKTAISVMKKWDDLNDQDGKRPEKIKAQLYANGVKSGPEVELSKDNGWTYTWNNLDKNKNGKPIKYTVDEVSALPSGYIKAVDDSDPNKVVITNSRQVEKINICGKKTWDDNNDQDGKRPTQITVNLLKNGTKFKTVTVKADDNGNWKYEFTNLDKYENKKEIKYTVEEEKVE
ncbi:Cna B-type domain-containing protein, partial [Eggerthia catenaformis]|uniref:Cna B-type domain-containing protein n=1 Tax=Eggerthia catenaformis TaxID=31973 RepID=UPI0028E1A972